jgi:hypothetical protein
VAGRIKRNLLGAPVEQWSQSELHAFVDDLQLGIGELHEEIARAWFPPPIGEAA